MLPKQTMTKDGEKRRLVIEAYSPYHLHMSEGPGALIAVEVFDGENYDLLKWTIWTALKSKKQTQVHRWNPKGTGNQRKSFYRIPCLGHGELKICSWFLNMIERKLRHSVACVDTAKAMWEDLQKRYGVASAPKIHQLKENIFECRQGGMSIAEFYSKLRGLWSVLDKHFNIPTCTCSRSICKGCECNIGPQIKAMFEVEKSY